MRKGRFWLIKANTEWRRELAWKLGNVKYFLSQAVYDFVVIAFLPLSFVSILMQQMFLRVCVCVCVCVYFRLGFSRHIHNNWIVLYQWTAENGWVETQLGLPPHMPALFMTSQTRASQPKMAALTVVFSRLLNADGFSDKSTERKMLWVICFTYQFSFFNPFLPTGSEMLGRQQNAYWTFGVKPAAVETK